MVKRLILAVIVLGLIGVGVVGFNMYRDNMIADIFAKRSAPAVPVSYTHLTLPTTPYV